MNHIVIEKFKHYFTRMDFTNDAILDEIYSDKVVFTDPIHEIHGIKNLTQYFNKLNDNLIEGSFLFTSEDIVGNKAYLSWEMRLRLKKPQKNVQTSGISVLIVEEKVIEQRDYFDAGELFYENIPVLGTIIRFFKKKIAMNER